MKLRKSVLALAIAGFASGGAQASWVGNFQTSNGTNTNDGVLFNINGLDIHSNGSAAFFCATPGGCAGGAVAFGTQLDPGLGGQIGLGDYVTTVYQGIVSAFNPGVSAPNLISPSDPTGTYQMTVAATFNEVVSGGVGTTALLTTLTGGRLSLFFDDGAGMTLANIAAGTGFTDGNMIADGWINYGGISTYTVFAGGSTGFATIGGQFAPGAVDQGVDMGNPAVGEVGDVVGFMPDTPVAFVSSTTLQYGSATGGNADHQTSKFFAGNYNGWGEIAVDAGKTVRADANSDLMVPEPATLALVGLGLAGLGLSVRRRVA